jgi:hypothetical protein
LCIARIVVVIPDPPENQTMRRRGHRPQAAISPGDQFLNPSRWPAACPISISAPAIVLTILGK